MTPPTCPRCWEGGGLSLKATHSPWRHWHMQGDCRDVCLCLNSNECRNALWDWWKRIRTTKGFWFSTGSQPPNSVGEWRWVCAGMGSDVRFGLLSWRRLDAEKEKMKGKQRHSEITTWIKDLAKSLPGGPSLSRFGSEPEMTENEPKMWKN